MLEKNQIELRTISHKIASEMIIKNHYSHRMPISTIFDIGIFYKKRMVGVIIYNQGNSTCYHNIIPSCTPQKNIELIRLWTEDNLPCGLISRSIAISIKKIRKTNPLLEFIISFSDQGQADHYGTIYQASNFYYIGKSEGTEVDYFINGKKYHSRGVGATFGTSKIDELKEKFGDNNVKIIKKKNLKHRYIYPLKDFVKQYLENNKKNYFKKADVV